MKFKKVRQADIQAMNPSGRVSTSYSPSGRARVRIPNPPRSKPPRGKR